MNIIFLWNSIRFVELCVSWYRNWFHKLNFSNNKRESVYVENTFKFLVKLQLAEEILNYKNFSENYREYKYWENGGVRCNIDWRNSRIIGRPICPRCTSAKNYPQTFYRSSSMAFTDRHERSERTNCKLIVLYLVIFLL